MILICGFGNGSIVEITAGKISQSFKYAHARTWLFAAMLHAGGAASRWINPPTRFRLRKTDKNPI